MDKVTVELTHTNALQLLQDLEKMDIIRIEKEFVDNSPGLNASKFRGKMSAKSADSLRKHVNATRNDWEQRFPSNL